VLTADNHNSVNGLAGAARRAAACVSLVPLDRELRAANPDPWLPGAGAPSLFGYPAQSNFSGVRHPLAWIALAHRRGYRVLLDAASYAPSERLDLSATPADFVALSFYKVFGYPTGVGALVARRSALAELRRRYFAGGRVEFVSMPDRMVRRRTGAAGFEDGTVPFLAMDPVSDGLAWMDRIGLAAARHSTAMTAALLDRLRGLGDDVVIYGPRDLTARGGTVTFNVRRHGAMVPYEEVEAVARACAGASACRAFAPAWVAQRWGAPRVGRARHHGGRHREIAAGDRDDGRPGLKSPRHVGKCHPTYEW